MKTKKIKNPDRSYVHLRLTLDVCYNLNGCSIESMQMQLHKAMEFLASEGKLSGESEACVTEWDCKVERVS